MFLFDHLHIFETSFTSVCNIARSIATTDYNIRILGRFNDCISEKYYHILVYKSLCDLGELLVILLRFEFISRENIAHKVQYKLVLIWILFQNYL